MGGRGKIFLKNGLLFSVLQVGDRNGPCHGHGGDSEEGEAERVVFPAVADEEGDAPGGDEPGEGHGQREQDGLIVGREALGEDLEQRREDEGH